MKTNKSNKLDRLPETKGWNYTAFGIGLLFNVLGWFFDGEWALIPNSIVWPDFLTIPLLVGIGVIPFFIIFFLLRMPRLMAVHIILSLYSFMYLPVALLSIPLLLHM